MNKFYVLTLLSIGVGSLYAEAPDLKKITAAIDHDDFDCVKKHWERIAQDHTKDEKRKALEKLIDAVSDHIEDHKRSVSTGCTKNCNCCIIIRRIIPGGLGGYLALAGIAYIISAEDRYAPCHCLHGKIVVQTESSMLVKGLICLGIGGYLLETALNKGTEQTARSQATIIKNYLEGQLHELDETDEEDDE